MTGTTPARPVLEAAARSFAEATANPPYLFDLAPAEGRKAVDEVQSGDIAKPAVDEEWVTVPGGPTGSVRARIVKPAGAEGTLPVVLYIHGAGWVFGNAHTHDRLVRELAVGANAAVVFPEGAAKDLDATRIAVAGDSVGGNMTAALTLMAKERGDVPLVQQVLFYPVTDANFDTRQQAAHGRSSGHRRALPGHHPRLRYAQRPARDPRRRSRDHAGDHHPAHGAGDRLTARPRRVQPSSPASRPSSRRGFAMRKAYAAAPPRPNPGCRGGPA
ncbi:hypothetical protein OK074_0760 [Actinobacteria bacterium OK074]|nr:hypothetical protein OK074_0760 [Actinobacteria bacterium OK074]